MALLNIECRTCFNASGGLNPLTKMYHFNKKQTKSYAELIEEVTKINIKDKHPDLSQSICDKCLRCLKSAHKFIQQAKEVNEKLYAVLNEKLHCLAETASDGQKGDIEIKIESNAQEAEEKIDCLEETQIDLETFLEIKIENKKLESEIEYLDRLKECREIKDENRELKQKLVNECFMVDKEDNDKNSVVEETKQAEINNDDEHDSGSWQTNVTDSDSDWHESENELNRKFIKQKKKSVNKMEWNSRDYKETKAITANSNSDLESEQIESITSKDENENKTNKNLNKPKTKSANKVSNSSNEVLNISESAVPCSVCNKIYQNSKALESHLKISHIPEDKKCSCPLCGNKYVKYSNMYAHMRTAHGPDSVIYMNKPERPESDYIYKCDKCPKKYCQKKSLVKHKQSKHNPRESEMKKKKIKPVNPGSLCPICGKVFTSRNHLTAHVRQHTGERPFKCDFCDRSFLVVTELNRHRRQHTGDKPHKCEKCDKAFVSAKYLRQHMASHSDERPNKCTQCERRYKFPQDLRIHMLTHTGERPYVCAVCGDSFQRPVSLRQHRKIHEWNVGSSST